MTTALLVLAAAVALGAMATLFFWARVRARKRSLATAAGALEELGGRLEASRRRLAAADARWAALHDAPGLRAEPVTIAGPNDTLTRLGGRSAFLERLVHELANGQPGVCTLLVLDVDGFAGATEGRERDSALVELAALLRGATNDEGVAFRIGAGEFALIFPGGGLGEAEQAFARLQAALRQGVLPRGVVVTGGIAATEPGDRALEVLLRADEALRQAKSDARGSAVVGAASSTLP